VAHDEDLDLLKAIRICAVGAVKEKDSDYVMRYIFRWYSREFHTPLHVIDELPLEEVLTHFFECRFENMDDEEIEEAVAKLIETRAERTLREAKEKAEAEEDDEFYKDTLVQAKKLKAKSDARKANPSLDSPIDPDIGRPLLLPVMGEKLPQSLQDVADKVDPKLKTVPAEIKMQFISESELNQLDDWDVLGPPTPDKL
jgi:hypothetical protein